MPGIESAEVGDWREGTAAVVADAKVSEEALAESVAKAGYRAIVDAKRPLEGERSDSAATV
ncbi:MAG: heavy-metal-associated domain-containing protein [Pseudomonadota bacterium]|nr:heavy-metal-associated domain-containing protein [Pseudomonadota bacterium]